MVDFKILGGILLQVTSLQGGMLVKMGQASEERGGRREEKQGRNKEGGVFTAAVLNCVVLALLMVDYRAICSAWLSQ